MNLVAVDLAAKFSAACVMTDAGTVTDQVDSWGRTETSFIDAITAHWIHDGDPPAALVVEDLPHGVTFMTITKAVCRLQGRIAERMEYYGALNSMLFVPPALWRRSFVGMERGTGPEAVTPVAESLGYQPPDLSHRILGAGDKAIARKVASDYCAAFLIGRWAVETHARHGTFDTPGTARYNGPPPPRKPRKRL